MAHVRIDLPDWNEDLYRYLYHITLTFIFLYIIPLTSLAVFNYLLIKALREARNTRARMSVTSQGNYKQNSTVTLNLIIVISKFIICETPDFISAILGTINGVSQSEAYRIYNPIKEMMLICSSVLNFYIYCFFNTRFRNTLLVSCGCRKPRKRSDSSGQISNSSANMATSVSTINLDATGTDSSNNQTQRQGTQQENKL